MKRSKWGLCGAFTAMLLLASLAAQARIRPGSLASMYEDEIRDASSEESLQSVSLRIVKAPLQSAEAYELLEKVLRSKKSNSDTTAYLTKLCVWSEKNSGSSSLKKKSDIKKLRALLVYSELSPRDQWASCQKTREYQESKVFTRLIDQWLMVMDTHDPKNAELDAIRFYRSAGGSELSPGEITSRLAECERVFWSNDKLKPVTSEKGVLLELHHRKASQAQ